MNMGSGGAVVGMRREDAVYEAVRLMYRGYSTSLAYIGGEANGARECVAAKNELRRLIDMLGVAGRSSTILVELSRIGLGVDEELAFRQLEELVREASVYGIAITIDAEKPNRTASMLDIYKRAANRYPGIGVTLRTSSQDAEEELNEILPFSGRIRILEGEEGDTAAYLRLARRAIASGRLVSLAANDGAIRREARSVGLLAALNAEVELPYGTRSELLDEARTRGDRPRVILAYGGQAMV